MSNQRIFGFEKLNVWQEARKWVKSIYDITRLFPETEKFGLISQLRRASISVPTNIAEGSARKSSKDQAHFSQLAYSSLLESLNLLILSFDLEYLSESELISQRDIIQSLTAQLYDLYFAQKSAVES
ncbi:MAG: four helix bundle protein [Chthoniobacterales bacterium]|nr:four helix bundle protein [Chthoniobacterales bacterium]